MKVKEVYDILLKNGELLEMYPTLSGSWDKDGEEFSAIWEPNIGLIDENYTGYEGEY